MRVFRAFFTMENGFSSPRNDTFPAGLQVLVVDDDPTWLKILEKMLKKCSYEVTTCGLARDALKLLREKKDGYDIVISDVNMPDMDGFKLLEHVGLEMDLPVIMMSVDGETSRVMKGVQHGACDYLLKPICLKELKNIWQHVLRKKIHEVRDAGILEGIENIQMTRTGSDQSDDGQLLFGEDLTSPKKRKDAENKYADKEPGDSSSMKKARVIWSVDLHQKFVKAVDQIGFDKVGPKKILDLMNVPWLTRENVASHLQKYRLYLSRLQKENDLKQRAGVVKLSDSPSLESTASFDFQNQNNLQQKDTKISGYEYSGNSSLIQNEGPRSLESDQRGSVQMSVAEHRRILDINVPITHQPKSSLVGFGLSLASPNSEVNFVASDSTFSTRYSWCDVSSVQLKLENKLLREGDNFSQLQRLGQRRHMQTDYVQPTPQVISRISKMEKDVGGSLNFKTSDEYGPGINVVSSVWSYDNHRPVETNICVPNHQAIVPILHDPLSMKIQGSNWDCTGEHGSPQIHVNLGVPPLATLDENLPFCLGESDCFSPSIGVQNIEFSEDSCCYPGIYAEVPINLFADFDHEIHYDPADYALLDQGLFIA